MTNQEISKQVVNHRRHLHKNPELGGVEFKTQAYICQQLDLFEIPYQKLGTSTIADLQVAENFKWVALRADIDALAINETNDVEYCSQNEGVMHACGHDAHTAILLTTIQALIDIKEQLHVNVRFIFQKDEESNGGGEEICQAGFLKNVSHVYGLHVVNDLQVGEVGYKYGQMNAGGDEVDIFIKGKQAHGAYPHLGTDALVCAANIVTSAQSIVSRFVSPLDSTVITIGTIEGGDTPNTICQDIKMRGTIRNLNAETRVTSVKKFIEQTELIAQAHDCEIKIVHTPSYPPLINDDASVDYIIENAQALGLQAVDTKTPSLGLEDFAYYLFECPGAFFNLGTCRKNDFRNAHSSSFDIDDSALVYGVQMQVANCLNHGGENEN